MQEALKSSEEINSNSVSTSLTVLNDDCLGCIFERIHELPVQVQVAKVCKRFHYLISRIWKRKPENYILMLDYWINLLPHIDDLQLFLHAMRTDFHTVRLIDDCLSVFLKEMEEMGIVQLPSVRRCELQDNVMECYPKDEEIESLTKLLPNLQYLSLNTPITGCYLSKFQYLEELHLYDEETKIFELKPEYLNELLLNLRNLRVLDIRSFEVSQLTLTPNVAHCVRLQELKLNLNTLMSALNYVLMMPQLKSLKVLLDQKLDVRHIMNVDTFDNRIYRTEEFFTILRKKGPSIIGLAIDLYFMPLTQNWDNGLQYFNTNKLKFLAICNCDFDTHFLERYTQMINLEILCLRHARLLTNETVLKFLRDCPKLKYLDISYCTKIDKDLLPKAAEYLNKEKRNHILLIYYRMSGLEPEIEKNSDYWSTQKYMQLSADLPPDSDVGLSYVYRGFLFNFDTTIRDDSC